MLWTRVRDWLRAGVAQQAGQHASGARGAMACRQRLDSAPAQGATKASGSRNLLEFCR